MRECPQSLLQGEKCCAVAVNISFISPGMKHTAQWFKLLLFLCRLCLFSVKLGCRPYWLDFDQATNIHIISAIWSLILLKKNDGVWKKCGVLHFGGNNLCVQRLACRAISASAKCLVFCGVFIHRVIQIEYCTLMMWLVKCSCLTILRKSLVLGYMLSLGLYAQITSHPRSKPFARCMALVLIYRCSVFYKLVRPT